MGGELTVPSSGFAVFLKSIEYRYYSIFMLFLVPLLIVTGRDWGPMLVAERKVRVYGRRDGGAGAFRPFTFDSSDGENDEADDVIAILERYDRNNPKRDTPRHVWNMIGPVLALVFFIFFFLWRTGSNADGTKPEDGFLAVMGHSDPMAALLWGSIATSLVTMGCYLLQFKQDGYLTKPTRGSFTPSYCRRQNDNGDDDVIPVPLLTVHEGMEAFLRGSERIFRLLIVLTLAWATSSVIVGVGLDRFISEVILHSNTLDYRTLPTISFLVSTLIAFVTGTSWGTMAIVFPLILSPTYVVSDGDPSIFYGTVAGILSGAVAGDHTSLISDTTILSSLASECRLYDHVVTQAPYALTVIIWSVSIGTIPVGWKAYSNDVALGLGAVLAILTTFFLGVRIVNATGRYDLFTEFYLWVSKDEFLRQIKRDTVTAHQSGSYVTIRPSLHVCGKGKTQRGAADADYGSENVSLQLQEMIQIPMPFPSLTHDETVVEDSNGGNLHDSHLQDGVPP